MQTGESVSLGELKGRLAMKPPSRKDPMKTIDKYLSVCSGIATMSDTTDNKCACPDCKCEISEGHDVLKDGKHYCSEVCANGHAGDDDGCCDGACNCHG